jgi:hypothetical protein
MNVFCVLIWISVKLSLHSTKRRRYWLNKEGKFVKDDINESRTKGDVRVLACRSKHSSLLRA